MSNCFTFETITNFCCAIIFHNINKKKIDFFFFFLKSRDENYTILCSISDFFFYFSKKSVSLLLCSCCNEIQLVNILQYQHIDTCRSIQMAPLFLILFSFFPLTRTWIVYTTRWNLVAYAPLPHTPHFPISFSLMLLYKMLILDQTFN